MNEMKEINGLKEKYWAGETTLAEEQRLRSHMESHPEEAGPEQMLFTFFAEERQRTYERSVKMPTPWIKRLTHTILPLAASLILIVGAVWVVNNNSNTTTNEIIVDDPETALQITREAFALLNGKVDHGEQMLKDNIALINGTVDQGERIIKDNIIHLDKTLIFKNL